MDIAQTDIPVLVDIVFPALLGLLGWMGKRYVEQVVEDMNARIDARTQPIQRDANGGWSLPDGIKLMQVIDGKLDKMHSRITDVVKDVERIKGRLDQQTWDGQDRRNT